ncbi:hypothetical protein [uncultured Stenotrophomonas sp.]|uniref:hypothetical protein n=1 Tax=uncultured Stenotrophomonas sp. TaxID=165438 RepID=UPI0025FB2ABC|nr:hypothetical protein [uncultured Stenotrophomonas sp.]
MQPGKNNSSGVIGTSSSEGPAISYDQIMELIRQGAEGVAAQGRDVLPTLAICSAFDDFNTLSVAKGLDEEALTSLFLGHLGSSIRHASCILGLSEASAGGLGLRWLHSSRTAESVLGSDFALLVPAPGQEERYRLAVFQAKRGIGSTINVKRDGNWKREMESNADEVPTPANVLDKAALRERKQTADKQLEKYLEMLKSGKRMDTDTISELDAAQRGVAWQLTKLVILALRLRSSFQPDAAVSVNYVLWPEETGLPVTYAPVASATLGPLPEAAEKAKAGEKYSSRAQCLVPTQDQLRDLLMNWLTKEDSTDDWLDASAAADACIMVTDCVGTVAVVDLRGPGHSPQLEHALDGHDLSLRAEVKPLEGYGRHSAKSDLTL